jgi:hypothetical protein
VPTQGLFDVGADGGSRAKELSVQNKVDVIFLLPANVPNDLHGETETLILHNALRTALLHI